MLHSIDPTVTEAAYRLCEAGQTPRCLTVAILLRYGEWDQLASLRVHPHHYQDRESYFVDAVATEFLRKFEPLPTQVDREAAARANAFAAEAQCYKTNERLSPYVLYLLEGLPIADCSMDVLAYVRRVRKKIARVLGPIPSSLRGRFGKGATFADRGRLTTVPDKMTSAPTLTRSSDIVLYHWSETAWGRACYERRQAPLYTRGNRFSTVPKDAVKHRGIAVEPSLNVYHQLALGVHMKRRLKQFGLDLKEGQEVHRRVACSASRDGSACTIDLSSASDTVSYNLVKLLLPEDWFQLLSALRCENTFGLVKGKWLRLEKFSSMGNGFTFELETLIFGSLVAEACSSQAEATGTWGVDVFVYGDDIICPSSCYDGVKAVLEFFGMSLNERKSFNQGPFRESCGGDFWDGEDVRPHNQECDPDEPHKIISLLNGVRRICDKDWLSVDLRKRYLRCWFRILDALPENIRRCRGPKGLGDIVIHDDEERWSTKTRHSIRYLRVWKPCRYHTVSWNNWSADVVLAAALYGVGDTLRGPLGARKSLGVMPRDAVAGYGLGWVAYS